MRTAFLSSITTLILACGGHGSTIDQLDGATGDGSDSVDTGRTARDTGANLDSGPCAARTVEASVERTPVDIIWIVDNSVSMQPAIDEVTAGLDDFAALIGARQLDYRVIMLSLRSPTNPVMVGGSTRYAVCIPEPLAGDANCGNGERFFHSSVDIRSVQPLEQFLGTLAQTDGYQEGQEKGGEPWRDFLRPDSVKSIVVVSDDDSRLDANQFEHFPGGSNPWNSNTLPPGILEDTWSGLFDRYVFHGIYGWGDGSDPTVSCTFPGGGSPSAAGETYTELVTRTGGVRAQICDGSAAWSGFFDAVASAVEETAPLACEIALPDPPDGLVLDPTKVNVVIRGVGGEVTLRKVPDGASCGAAGGWYYDSDARPTEVRLCPTSCDLARAQVTGDGTGVDVAFDCDTLLI